MQAYHTYHKYSGKYWLFFLFNIKTIIMSENYLRARDRELREREQENVLFSSILQSKFRANRTNLINTITLVFRKTKWICSSSESVLRTFIQNIVIEVIFLKFCKSIQWSKSIGETINRSIFSVFLQNVRPTNSSSPKNPKTMAQPKKMSNY